MNSYKKLRSQIFSKENYSIVPIRYKDRFHIMKWRNEQMYHLRQNKLLTESDQTNYFNAVVTKLFDQEFPEQLLFSFLEDSKCIGYGGLVHINWIDQHAEISFIMDTKLEKDYFLQHWNTYLSLIEKVAFEELGLHKLFTYAYDIRPHLYSALEASGYTKEAILKEHCFFNNEYKNVIIHTKIARDTLRLTEATKDDARLLFDWSNDPLVRENSLNSEPIIWEEHLHWFHSKLQSDSKIFILSDQNQAAGMIRLDNKGDHFLISYSIDQHHRGKGFGKKIIELGLQKINEDSLVKAVVKKENISSVKIFEKLNFEKQDVDDTSVFYFIKKTGI